MTIETDDATERKRAPITPNWKLDISPIFGETSKIELNIRKTASGCILLYLINAT